MSPEQDKMLKDMHQALMVPPPGSARPPLIEEIREAVTFYKGSKFSARFVLWILPAVAATMAAIKYMKESL